MKDIKLRIHSVEGTRQITKAMELVASSKLRRAKERAERSRPYFNTLYEAITDIASSASDFNSPFLEKREKGADCYVVIAGDRGLAGGYNNNVFKLFDQSVAGKEEVCVIPVGKKAQEFMRRRPKARVLTEEYALVDGTTTADADKIAKTLCTAFLKGEIRSVTVIYTNFASMLSQVPYAMPVLPIEKSTIRDTAGGKARALTMYEPDGETVFNAVIPAFVSGIFYGAVCESLASEVAARRTAMDAASKNASAMIDDLNLRYNRARQGAITQEITEIVAGSEA
jgi:F-type H+-transporting ATPase subunit gamma